MTTDKHTAEPWQVGRGSRIEAGGYIVADMTHRPVFSGALAPKPRPSAEADARRIVACVNACAGISTEALERASVKALLDVIREDFGDAHGELDRIREHAEAFNTGGC